MNGVLILLRHALSEWNDEGLFTGWVDVDLSPANHNNAKKRAFAAGKLIREERLIPDVAYTSLLQRAIHTLWYCLEEMKLEWLTVHKDWRLNERHYGALEGLNKKMLSSMDARQIEIWRRSYAVQPPPVDDDDPRHPVNDLRYAHVPRKYLPATESLHDVVLRVKPYLEKNIMRDVRKGKVVLVAAHGNSIRAIIKILSEVSDKDIQTVNVPTAVPLVYYFDEKGKVKESRYLGDREEIARMQEAVANQSKVNK